MKILAVIGSESHSTSSGWAKIIVNGKRLTHRDAESAWWLSSFGDKHASWCECVFEIPEGAKVEWQAGTNSGNRGRDRVRQNLVLVTDDTAPVFGTDNLGYPARDAVLRGKLRLVSDRDADASEAHRRLADSI